MSQIVWYNYITSKGVIYVIKSKCSQRSATGQIEKLYVQKTLNLPKKS